MKVFEYCANELAKKCMQENNLNDFQVIWDLDAGWFEERNIRRGGWSGVSQYEIANGSAIFIKRQENHCYRAWDTFFLPVATFYREFKNIQRFDKHNIPTLELIYFGQRKEEGKIQATLITHELEGYFPLDSNELKQKLNVDFKLRRRVIKTIAEVIGHMHTQHLQHNCLYEKHIFVKLFQNGTIDVRLIDLEKVKWKPFKTGIMYRDLGSLYRHSSGWSIRDCLRFFIYYQNEDRLSKNSKKTLSSFIKKIKAKVNKKICTN